MTADDQLDPSERPIAESYLAKFLELRRASFDAQVAYGRWMLNSLLILHGGAILAITQTEGYAEDLFRACGLWLIAGTFCTLVAGGVTWLNWSWATERYDAWANPRMVVSRAAWPQKLTALDRKISFSAYAVIGLTIVSAVLLLIAGYAAYDALGTHFV